MKVRHIRTNNISYCLEYFEGYCIQNGISYVKLEKEIHFGDTILFFYTKEDILKIAEWERLQKIEKILEIEDNSLLVRKITLETRGIVEVGADSCIWSEEKEEKKAKKYRYPQYKEKKYKENTLGYPRKRIRKRF